jgi:tetratricopeptide (TPR) repeat protein
MRSLPPPPPSQQREVAAASPSATDRDDDSARPPSPPISAGVHLNSQSADQLSRSEIEADVAEFDSFDEAESDAEPIPPPISALTPASSQALSASAAVDETVALPSDPPPSPPILPTVPPNTAGNKANPVKPTLTDAALDTEDTTDVTETAAIDYPPTPSPDDEDEAAAITEVEPLDDALDIDLDWDSADDGITELELLPSEVDASQENPPSLTSPDVPALANDAASIASPLTGIGAGASNLANELDLEELDIVDAEPDFLDWSLHGSIQGERAAPASDQSATTAESEDAAPQLPYLPADPQAQSFLNQIEQLHRRRAEPMVLANAYRSLGNLYRDRIEQGNASPQTLMAAMHAYEQVLRWLDDGSPLWAEVLNDMGNLCWLLSRSSPAPDQGLPYLQQGIQFYQVALTKISPQTHPQTYPMIQNNLGAAYGDLARYQDPVENLQRSTQAYQEALRYRKAEDDPMRYASTQNNLGTTYWNLAQHHEPKVYLKQAIAAYAEALRYYRPEQEPLNYAMIQNNLGTAYWNLAQYEQAQDWLALALGAYRMALKYRTLDKAPLAFAATQNNLGTAYWHIATHTKDNPETKRDYLERAIAAYESALSAVQQLTQVAGGPVPLNFDALATHNNLGLVNYELVNDPQITLVNSTWSDCLKASLQNHVAAFQGWQHRLELRQTALQCIIQTVRAFFNKGGLEGQNLALSLLPGSLLPEILPKL